MQGPQSKAAKLGPSRQEGRRAPQAACPLTSRPSPICLSRLASFTAPKTRFRPNPPVGLFQEPQVLPRSGIRSFSSLAEQRWITISLAYLKEVGAINSRKAELKPKASASRSARAASARSSLLPRSNKGRWLGQPTRALHRALRIERRRELRSNFLLLLAGSGSSSPNFAYQDLILALLLKCFCIRQAPARKHAANGRHLPPQTLRRPPSPEQCRVYARLRGLVRACRRQAGEILVCAGRKGAAAPAEKAGHGLFRVFGRASCLFRAKRQPNAPACLDPYRPLASDRIVMKGRGNWDLASHLGPDVLMPYCSPHV